MKIEEVRMDPRCNIETWESDYARFHIPPSERFYVKLSSESSETDWSVELLLEGVVKISIDTNDIFIDRLSNCGEVCTSSRTSIEDDWTKDVYVTDLSRGEEYVISITRHESKIYSMLKKDFNGTVQLAVDVGIEI